MTGGPQSPSAADNPAGESDTGSDGFSTPTYHRGEHDLGRAVEPERRLDLTKPGPKPVAGRLGTVRPTGTGDLTVTRAVIARSQYLSKLLAHKVIQASEADGAKESGLTALIWNQVMSYGADAMITVALAGTVFFSASADAKRGNVLLYLAVTMAPFAVVAPVIGPALDRFQHGRRWVMAGTALGRAVLAAIMAMNFTDLFVLFPAALGSLVLSKAYAVIRAAAAPRLVPSGMTLVVANARLSMFGLIAAIVGGAIAGTAIKVTGSYPFGLWVTAAAFGATAVYAVKLPSIVDSPPTQEKRPDQTAGSDVVRKRIKGNRQDGSDAGKTSIAATMRRRVSEWSTRGFSATVLVAMQGETMMRWLSGFVTIFLAFYIEATSHGFSAVVSLGALGAATGLGNFTGTAIGTRLRMNRPDLTVIVCTLASAAVCVVTAIFFSIGVAVLAVLIAASANSLAKLSMDAIIQRDVAESQRSSAFARSETFLQLGWVLGATVALLLPSKQGQLGFIVAAVATGTVALVLTLRRRALAKLAILAPQTAPRPAPGAADGTAPRASGQR